MKQIFTKKAKTNFSIGETLILKGEVVYITSNYRLPNNSKDVIDVFNHNRQFIGTVYSDTQWSNLE